MIDELYEMLHPETLPLLRWGRRAHYEGSIDKTGGNADWDWKLYQDDNGEWVLFEQHGPGCVYNFVQHRYLDSPEPVFRFYFDDDTVPRFQISPSQFGEKYPFLAPLADKFIGPDPSQVIRVVRSFVPMPFTSYCKVTSSIPLEGNAIPGGGWGHVVYHTYSEDVPAASFHPDNPDYRRLLTLWSQYGRTPLLPESGERHLAGPLTLAPGESCQVFADSEGGLVTALCIRTARYSPAHLRELWIRIRFDRHPQADIELPWGAFFGNELGFHRTSCLYSGMDADGGYYFCFPMPYLEQAQIYLENRGAEAVPVDFLSVTYTRSLQEFYQNRPFGYLMSSPYYPKRHTKGADSLIASVQDVYGHVVSSTVTGYPFSEGGRADCEGDVRIHFDGIRTPQIESDGSESYICYGWGFCSPPQHNPASCYDGEEQLIHKNWSMTRQLPGDCYPFLQSLHFGIESFWCNDDDMYHSGAVLFYGARKSLLTRILEYREGDEVMTSFFEGDDDHIACSFTGTRASRILLSIPVKGYDEILLRRVSDQGPGRQAARVSVDSQPLLYPWYCPDHNPCKRWLEDEYVIPSRYCQGRDTITVQIDPIPCGGDTHFNQFGICVLGMRMPD